MMFFFAFVQYPATAAAIANNAVSSPNGTVSNTTGTATTANSGSQSCP